MAERTKTRPDGTPAHPAGEETLATNSMAVLGLLAVSPMTAYGLAEQMTRSIGWVWTASRRLLLGEPRRLAAKGLVESVSAEPGSRAGQRWRATRAGSKALRRWLKTPVVPTRVHSELALRLIFADKGDLEDLTAQIDVRRTQLRAELRTGVERIDEYLTTGGPFPDRLHVTTATIRFITEMLLVEHQFLDWLRDEVRGWPDTTTPVTARQHAVLLETRSAVNAVLDRP